MLVKRWWVFFGDARPDQRWFYRFWPGYRAPFKHCFACVEVADNLLVWIVPSYNILQVWVEAGRPAEAIRSFIEDDGGRVVFMERPRPRLRELALPTLKQSCFLTCATVIAYALGIESRCVSPRGLYRELVNHYGGVEIDGRRWRRQQSESQAGAASGGDS